MVLVFVLVVVNLEVDHHCVVLVRVVVRVLLIFWNHLVIHDGLEVPTKRRLLQHRSEGHSHLARRVSHFYLSLGQVWLVCVAFELGTELLVEKSLVFDCRVGVGCAPPALKLEPLINRSALAYSLKTPRRLDVDLTVVDLGRRRL